MSASVSDATSGPAQTEDSAAADTTTVGAKTATVTGTDLAGNQATSGCGYRVSYRFDESTRRHDWAVTGVAAAGAPACGCRPACT